MSLETMKHWLMLAKEAQTQGMRMHFYSTVEEIEELIQILEELKLRKEWANQSSKLNLKFAQDVVRLQTRKISFEEIILRTSEEWQNLHPHILVADPDGWDRTNFAYSWSEEKITREEWSCRVGRSTCRYSYISEPDI